MEMLIRRLVEHSLGCYPRSFTFHLGNPISSILKIPVIQSKLRDLRDLYG